MVTVWWSAAHLIHYTFLNPSEIITSKKYVQQINEMHQKLQCLQPALVNRKGPILHNNTRQNVHWTNWATKLISCQLTSNWTPFCRKNASTISRRQKMLSKSLSNPKAQIFMLQNKQTYLSLAKKMCWLKWFLFWLIKYVCSQWEFAVWPRELKPRLSNNLEVWAWERVGRGSSRGRGHMYTYGWFMLIFGRNQYSIIKQLSFN